MDEERLSAKQITWCQEYLVDLNATQAAIRAGYSEKTAKQIGTENLSKPVLKAKIQEYMDLRAKRTEITADRVLTELYKLGFADVRKIFTSSGGLLSPSDMDDDISAAIQQIEVVTRMSGEEDDNGNKVPEYIHKIKLADKKSALELLGKHLKLYTDKVEQQVSGVDGKPIQIAATTMTQEEALEAYKSMMDD